MLEDRENGITEELVALQTKIALKDVSKEDLKNVIIAYEPVWAIGTGKTATSEQANEVCAVIRSVIAKVYDKTAADGMTIQYGGSMNAGNAAELLAQPDVDGGLIGGASLKAPDFCRHCRRCYKRLKTLGWESLPAPLRMEDCCEEDEFLPQMRLLRCDPRSRPCRRIWNRKQHPLWPDNLQLHPCHPALSAEAADIPKSGSRVGTMLKNSAENIDFHQKGNYL